MHDRIRAVQRMQEYIEAHLSESITLADLAGASMFSPWYASRLFKELTGLTPADYIRRLKLSRSALRLRDEACRVIDVAFDMGFGSVDGYQRAFFREFGCNPREYSAHPIPLRLFIPYKVEDETEEKEKKAMKEIQSVFVQIIEKPERKVLIKRGVRAEDYFEYCEEVGCDIWGLLTSIHSISGEPVCMWLPERFIKPGTSRYVQGVEVPADYDGGIPEGFDVVTMPGAEFLMFQGEPFAEEDYEQAICAVQTAMEKYNPSVLGLERDAENPRIQLQPIGERGYIEMFGVKRVKDK